MYHFNVLSARNEFQVRKIEICSLEFGQANDAEIGTQYCFFAERTLGGVEADAEASKERADREGASHAKENMAEHFAAEAENDLKWDVPENPFKQARSSAGKPGRGRKGRRK